MTGYTTTNSKLDKNVIHLRVTKIRPFEILFSQSLDTLQLAELHKFDHNAMKSFFCSSFQPPQHPDSWTGVRDATKIASKCMQYMPLPLFSEMFGPDKGKEDCLYANVYTPAQVSTNSLISRKH